jgi:hypothetical protein
MLTARILKIAKSCWKKHGESFVLNESGEED